ncbi:hypothetical protein B5X24_HaOG205919 [Helicoverpa armigera]|uniref:C2H2-type domain-containing protein n=1 Tax=Helicoverpa armigera TaxID=29058 RepID=A0A2W1BV21_HELAM|nr:hypothetical protein B5X24_HaOG205919 [Helicoverpa armigera]
MTEIWNISGLCRCCHAEGNFTSVNVFSNGGIEDDCHVLLQDTFDIVLNPLPNSTDTYSLCSVCEPRLRDAAQFKKQVLLCEDKFKQYLFGCGFKDAAGEKEFKNEFTDNGLKEESSHDEQAGLDYKYDEDSLQELDIFIQPAEDDDQPLSVLRSSRGAQPPDSAEPDAEWAAPPELSDDEDRKPKNQKTKKYSCDICQKKFSYNGSLEVHMKAHNGEKSFTCHLCSTTHTNNKELTKHITIAHIVDNAYPCTICQKIFEKARLLKKHIKVHFEEKFKCTECNKEFQRKKVN